MQIVKNLATKIREFRKLKGLSQAEMAELCELSTRGYQEIEIGKSGSVRSSTLEKLIMVTGFSEEELLGTVRVVKSSADMKTEAMKLLLELENESNIEQVLKTLEILHNSENKGQSASTKVK